MNADFLLETILKFLDEGVLVVDQQARVTFLNEPAGDITGLDRERAIGRSLFEIFPGLNEETSTLFRVLKTGRPLIDYVQTYANHKGKTVTKVTSTIPLFQNGVCIGALEIYREISHIKKMMERLSELEKQLHQKKGGKKGLATAYTGNGTIYSMLDIIGISEAMTILKKQIVRVADSNSSILVYGETGTGKELAVQSIHNASETRKSQPFIAQNCAAIPYSLLESILFGTAIGGFTGAQDKPGLFELANKGTLFLDEINTLDMDLQAKLLRVLQDGVIRRVGDNKSIQVSVRVIAATNEEPLDLVASGRLRADLYYRLNVISLKMPPLRERKEDIPALVEHFINRYNQEMKLSVKALDGACMAALMAYPWPGNIRELQFAIERMMNFATGEILGSDSITQLFNSQILPEPTPALGSVGYMPAGNMVAEHMPPSQVHGIDHEPLSLQQQMAAIERDLICKAIDANGGNFAAAARHLGIPRQTLHHKIKKYQITVKIAIE